MAESRVWEAEGLVLGGTRSGAWRPYGLCWPAEERVA